MGCKSQAGTVTSKTYRAPDFKLTTLKGEKISLASLRGNVIFLDFWATWCPPCVMSAPEVDKLHAEYKRKKVVIVSVSLDNGPEPVKRFLSRHPTDVKVTLAGDSGIDSSYRIEGIPAFFIIDQKGNITNAWEGYNPAMTKLWRKEIDRLLAI